MGLPLEWKENHKFEEVLQNCLETYPARKSQKVESLVLCIVVADKHCYRFLVAYKEAQLGCRPEVVNCV
jgi:hypothetical protein